MRGNRLGRVSSGNKNAADWTSAAVSRKDFRKFSTYTRASAKHYGKTTVQRERTNAHVDEMRTLDGGCYRSCICLESDSMSTRDERIKAQAGRDELFKDDFRKLMSAPSGRRIVHWLLANSGVLRTTFVEVKEREHYMALAMAHAEGKKDMGYRLMAKISEICPENYTLMMKENEHG